MPASRRIVEVRQLGVGDKFWDHGGTGDDTLWTITERSDDLIVARGEQFSNVREYKSVAEALRSGGYSWSRMVRPHDVPRPEPVEAGPARERLYELRLEVEFIGPARYQPAPDRGPFTNRSLPTEQHDVVREAVDALKAALEEAGLTVARTGYAVIGGHLVETEEMAQLRVVEGGRDA